MKWNLQRLQFLLSHIEDFVENDWREIREKARTFSPQLGLDNIEDIVEPTNEIRPPSYVLDRLTPFFESGLLLSNPKDKWTVTDVFWRGSVFHLEPDEQSPAGHLVNDITPLQVRKAPAGKILSTLGMQFLAPGADCTGYLVRPAPQVGFVLFSNLADPWALDHVTHAHRLINKAFVY